MTEPLTTLEKLMALGWLGATVAMTVHIGGSWAFGWSTSHVSWWVALALLLGMSAANTYTYVGGYDG